VTNTLSDSAVRAAAEHLADVLAHAFEHTSDRSALVVWDDESELACGLAAAYRICLPTARFIAFDETPHEEIRTAFEQLEPDDLVVLIQSTSFRLDAFRIRIELFARGLKVIEHPHLARMTGAEALVYVDSLAYDPSYYRGVGRALADRIDRCGTGIVESGDGTGDPVQLVYPAAFEWAKVNIGDYAGMRNVGGQYPIGEVFTESRDLAAVHGRVRISFFGDTAFTVNRPSRPITLVVEEGRVARAEDSTPEFDRVLANIRADDGEVWVRELGFGLNRAFGQERTVTDIGTFERMCGVHLSLGSKHATYNKPEHIRKKSARHHVDVFALTDRVLLDDEVVYEKGAWIVGV
jgi:aminopeptidase